MCNALRNKEFHLKPTPCRDSRLTFLYVDIDLAQDYLVIHKPSLLATLLITISCSS